MIRCICRDIESQPPQYYNESTIVKKLETSGIGRPSTYASIIATILNRNYTVVKTIPEKELKIGDLVMLKSDINHGVYPIDQDTTLSDNSIDGRWIMFSPYHDPSVLS